MSLSDQDYDAEVIFDENVTASSIPSTCTDSQDRFNPFRFQRTFKYEEITPRYFKLPQKLLPSISYKALTSTMTKEVKLITIPERRVSDPETNAVVSKDDADHKSIKLSNTVNIELDKTRKEIRSDPYQIEINKELTKYFEKISRFKGIDESRLREHKIKLRPLKVHKKTLILDLDGTLICNLDHVNHSGNCKLSHSEVIVKVTQSHRDDKKISFYVRPYVQKLLKTLSVFYEIIVFTAGKESYAKSILEYLDPKKVCIEYLLHRSHCIISNDWTIKDLRIIGRRELKDMIIIDNSVISFAGNMDNGIYIPTFNGDPNDIELLPIINFLKEIADVDDVRPYVSEFAGVQRLYNKHRTTNVQ